jgi:type VII secretion protein EccB
MQTRRDQLQAYRFVTRRIVSALLSGEPETAERPMRRYGLAVFGSAMLAAILFAGVGVYGFLFPSGAKLPESAIVIERETGARYVYLDGRLHPVLNFASARLLLGSEDPTVQRVSQRSLRAYPRGRAVGIANLPDPLPDRSAMTTGPWSACSLRRGLGSTEFVTHLNVGSVPPGGEPLGDRGLLMEQRTSQSITLWFVSQGRRMEISTDSLTALGMTAARPVQVTNQVISGVPAGPQLAVPPITDLGGEGPTVDGEPATVGRVYVAAGQHYVLLNSGLATIGPIMRDLLLASDDSVTSISASAAAAARSAQTPSLDPPGFPTSLPNLAFTVAGPAMVCAVSGPADDTGPSIMVYERADTVESTGSAQARTGPDGVRLADHVDVAAGAAAIVRTLPAPGATTPSTTTYLVTDQGVRYALPRQNTEAVLASLGYGGVTVTPVPTFLLALLPTGPTLDPVAARQFVVEGVATPAPTDAATPG